MGEHTCQVCLRTDDTVKRYKGGSRYHEDCAFRAVGLNEWDQEES